MYRFDRQPAEGFAAFGPFAAGQPLELISLAGALQQVEYGEIKALCQTAEAGEFDLFRKFNLFERRPKVPGLWTRFIFRDGDRLDGILPHNLLEWPEAGYLVTPPRAGAARQRVFIPRNAVIGTELRGVVGRSTLSGRITESSQSDQDLQQLSMFES